MVAMADGFAQARGSAAFVNLHSAIGVGHALGSIFTAYRNQTPLVVTAGQQARSILPFEPFLYSEQATNLPRPYVKWSCEPARAEDVPAAIARAYYVAMQSPRGPTFVSVPVDDWDRACEPGAVPRGQRRGRRRPGAAGAHRGAAQCRTPSGSRRRRRRGTRWRLARGDRARRAPPGPRVGESAVRAQQLSGAASAVRGLPARGPRQHRRAPGRERSDRGTRRPGFHLSRRRRRPARAGRGLARTADQQSGRRGARPGRAVRRHGPQAWGRCAAGGARARAFGAPGARARPPCRRIA